MKTCICCHIEQPLDAFHKDKYQPDGLTTRCKQCRKNRVQPINQPHDGMKRCPGCHETKPVSEFSPSNINKSGLQSHCRMCHSMRNGHIPIRHRDFAQCRTCKLLYPATPEFFCYSKGKIDTECLACRRTHANAYYYANHDEVLQKQHEYTAANRDRILERHKLYWAVKKETLNARRQARYAANPDVRKHIRAKYRQFIKNNPEKNREYFQRRKALEIGAEGSHTAEQIKEQYTRQKGVCYYCHDELNGQYHIEHVIPLSRGGSNSIENIVLACAPCNFSKSDKLPHEWPQGGRLL